MKNYLYFLPLLLACTQAPPVSPKPDASDAAISSCDQACKNLANLGCPIGLRPTCSSFISSMTLSDEVANQVTKQPLTCTDIVNAKTIADIKSIGFGCSDAGLP